MGLENLNVLGFNHLSAIWVIMQHVPTTFSKTTNQYLCEDAKEDIESTKGLFWMRPFDGEYPYKRKTYASDSKLNKQCPFLKNNNFLSALREILSEVYLWVSISCFSERSLKLFFQYKLLNKTSQNFATFKRHLGTLLQKLS